MTPNEILEKLKKMGVEISPRTLQNYVAWDLVDAPITKSMGRAKGRVTKYEDDAFAKIYAAHRLINGDYRLTREHTTEVAFDALQTIHGHDNDIIHEYITNTYSYRQEYINLLRPVDKFVFLWIFYYCQALENKFYSKANVAIGWNVSLNNKPAINITVGRPLKSTLMYGTIKIHLNNNQSLITLMEVADYNNINLLIIKKAAGYLS